MEQENLLPVMMNGTTAPAMLAAKSLVMVTRGYGNWAVELGIENFTKTLHNLPNPNMEHLENGVIQTDGIEAVKRLPDGSIHLILSDIPYGIAAANWDVLHGNTNSALLGTSPAQQRAGAIFKSRGKPINGWSEADRKIPKEYYDWCSKWAGEWLRILKPGASAIVFAGR